MTATSKPSNSVPARAANAWIEAGHIALGAAIALTPLACVLSAQRFSQLCFVAFWVLLTVGLGGLFLVLLHHLLDAKWTACWVGHMRWTVWLILASAPLLVPVALSQGNFLVESCRALSGHGVHSFGGVYYQAPLVLTRLVACWITWCLLGFAYTRTKRDRDVHSDARAARLKGFSGPALALHGLTVTSASFDGLMILQRGWQSAVFGVYVFSGAVCAALAVLSISTAALNSRRPLPGFTNDTQHDLAKLLFGFVLFWAYIAFSQYLLIWYARLPAEMSFYRVRSGPAWNDLTLVIIALHFAVPFVVLLSERAKRSTPVLVFAAGCVLCGHALDVYGLVMPALGYQAPQFGFAELAAVALTAAIPFYLSIAGAARDVRQAAEEMPESFREAA